jgi:FixJ family two-component response regulator
MCAPKPRRNVAIVDDDPGMLRGLSDLLGACGFETDMFSSAEEWLDRGDLRRIDCLLLDVQLGGISGIELQRQLKALGSTLPIVFMTAFDDEETRAQASQAGCLGWLRKPFSSQQLIEAIERAAS